LETRNRNQMNNAKRKVVSLRSGDFPENSVRTDGNNGSNGGNGGGLEPRVRAVEQRLIKLEIEVQNLPEKILSKVKLWFIIGFIAITVADGDVRFLSSSWTLVKQFLDSAN